MTVPHRYLVIWIGSGFPYYAQLAVESIGRADPGAAIEVHVLGRVPTTAPFVAVTGMANVSVHPIDLDSVFAGSPRPTELRQLFDRIPATANSARSNLLRYALLHDRGGVYVDVDVFVRRPLADLAHGGAFVGVERVWKHDRARVEGRWALRMLPATIAWALAWFAVRVDGRVLRGRARISRRLSAWAPRWSALQANNAVIGAPAGSPFVARLLERSLTADPTVRYALGPSLVAEVVDSSPELVTTLAPEVLYPVPPGESGRYFDDRTLVLPDECALVHYVASNHGRLLESVRPSDRRTSAGDAVFWRLAREIERGRTEPDRVTRHRFDPAPHGLVSCLMVTRDRPELARTAVQCFADQTWPDRELVIVDDGDQSYDDVLAPFLAAGHRIRYIRQPHRRDVRLGALRNVAIEAAAGDWCIQWDDDEWYHPERIAMQMWAGRGAHAVALQWTLVTVDSSRHGELAFRADAGIATPGTILHRRDAARYPNLARGEDSEFLRTVRRTGALTVLGRDASHLFVRRFHGANTWDEAHFVARLHRRPADWPSYAAARWWHQDLRRHAAFRLEPRELATIAAVRTAELDRAEECTWSA